MAPSDEGQYDEMSLDDLKTQCVERELDISEAETADDYVRLLLESEKTDWAHIFCRVLYHTGMAYEEIGRRTLPQINAILEGAGENLAIKLGIPYGAEAEAENEQPLELDNDTRLAEIGQLERFFNR